MKRLTQLVLFLLVLSAPSWATWTCAQGATGCTVTTTRDCVMSTTTCGITVTSTHAHAVEVLCGQFPGAGTTLTGSGDGTWTTATGSHGTDTTAGGVECAYNLNATGSATTITCTASASSSQNQCMFFEFTGTGSSFTFDTANTVDDSSACTSCNGVAFTLGTSNNYILIQGSSCAGTCSAINQSYTGVFVSGDGFAFKINVTSAGTTPSWTSTSGRLAGGAIAIYEVTSAAPHPHAQLPIGGVGQ